MATNLTVSSSFPQLQLPASAISYVTTDNELDRAHEYLNQEQDAPIVLGFDQEWRPGNRQEPAGRVAVLQLAQSHCSFVFDLTRLETRGKLPQKLCAILEDRNILKAGVGVQGDAIKLHQDWGIALAGCIDLSLLCKSLDALVFEAKAGHYEGSNLAKRMFIGRYTEPLGLKRLLETFCLKTITKNSKVRTGNWESGRLNYQQVTYAALDAYAGYCVYRSMEDEAKTLPESMNSRLPKRLFYCFDVCPTTGGLMTSGDAEARVLPCDFTRSLQETNLPWDPLNPEYDPELPAPPTGPTLAPTTTGGPSAWSGINAIGFLNEFQQQNAVGSITYSFSSTGPPHMQAWTATCLVGGIARGQATNATKQLAKESSAANAIVNMGL
ncbi:hypothetical protein VNI00_018245 [Paramarasmius palmivorus]|uniref:3'-5' exonuclease n=1 Tax=Paramarasmius palmivorus TaxID=297713 RepID=A0AAW0AYN4_9AGAR